MTWKIGDEGTAGGGGVCGLKSKEKRSWNRERKYERENVNIEAVKKQKNYRIPDLSHCISTEGSLLKDIF
jgi:hypothetical protein